MSLPSLMQASAALLLVAGLSAGCGSSFDPPHRTSIALGHHIGPVSYGEPHARITKTLGRGLVGVQLDGQLYSSYPEYGIYVAYPPIYVDGGTFSPQLKPAAAAIVMTRSAQYKTHSGVGVGSTLRELQQRIQVGCSIATGMSTPTRCQYGNPTATTVFAINPKTKRVSQVAIVPAGE